MFLFDLFYPPDNICFETGSVKRKKGHEYLIILQYNHGTNEDKTAAIAAALFVQRNGQQWK